MNQTAGTRDQISRRTVVRAAAWSVPVIAAAVALPHASASTAPFSVATNTGTDFFINEGGMTAALIWPGANVTNATLTPISFTWTVTVQAIDGVTVMATGTATMPPAGAYAIPPLDFFGEDQYIRIWDGVSPSIPPALVTISITGESMNASDTITYTF